MFASTKPFLAADILFTDTNTFLFRDQRTEAKKVMNLHILFNLVNFGNVKDIRNSYKDTLQTFCNCKNIEWVRMDDTTYEHLLKQKPLTIHRREGI